LRTTHSLGGHKFLSFFCGKSHSLPHILYTQAKKCKYGFNECIIELAAAKTTPADLAMPGAQFRTTTTEPGDKLAVSEREAINEQTSCLAHTQPKEAPPHTQAPAQIHTHRRRICMQSRVRGPATENELFKHRKVGASSSLHTFGMHFSPKKILNAVKNTSNSFMPLCFLGQKIMKLKI